MRIISLILIAFLLVGCFNYGYEGNYEVVCNYVDSRPIAIKGSEDINDVVFNIESVGLTNDDFIYRRTDTYSISKAKYEELMEHYYSGRLLQYIDTTDDEVIIKRIVGFKDSEDFEIEFVGNQVKFIKVIENEQKLDLIYKVLPMNDYNLSSIIKKTSFDDYCHLNSPD